MSAAKISGPIEFEEGRIVRRAEEEESLVQNLHKASSDVTAAIFALELIKESSTPRADSVSKASKLLTEVLKELKKALYSHRL